MYGGVGAGLFLILWLLNVKPMYWTPIFIIYGVASIAHMVIGLDAVSMNIKSIVEGIYQDWKNIQKKD